MTSLFGGVRPDGEAVILDEAALLRPVGGVVDAQPPMDSEFTEVVYVEGLVGRIYVEGETDTYIYHFVFDWLLDTALSPEESTGLIARNDHRLSAAIVLNT